jgi:hypothetical protein
MQPKEQNSRVKDLAERLDVLIPKLKSVMRKRWKRMTLTPDRDNQGISFT